MSEADKTTLAFFLTLLLHENSWYLYPTCIGQLPFNKRQLPFYFREKGRIKFLEYVRSGEGMLRSYLGHGAEVLSEFTLLLFLLLLLVTTINSRKNVQFDIT